MVWLRSESIAIAALIITTSFALLNYLYARRRTQPQPRIYISKVRVEQPYIIRENKPPGCRIKLLFRNSGEISTVMDLSLVINVHPYYSKRKKDVAQTLVPALINYEFPLDSGQNHSKAFVFDLVKEVENWEEGTLAIFGSYLGYKDKERNILLLFGGKRTDQRWKLLIYNIEEDTFLGVIKRGIWFIRSKYQKIKYRKVYKNTPLD